MSDSLDYFIQKMNSASKKIAEKTNIYFKKAIFKGEEYADKGIKQIENEKLKWKLKKAYIDLGKYIDVSNQQNIVDYSDDEKFILMLERINRIKKNINEK